MFWQDRIAATIAVKIIAAAGSAREVVILWR
jgi:hypothetical protein